MCVTAVVLLLFLHASLPPVALVALVVNCPPGAVPAPWVIESFTGGLY